MKKGIKKICKILVALIISAIIIVVLFFYLSPSSFLKFYTENEEGAIWAEGIIFPFRKEISGTKSLKPFNPEWSPDKKHLAFFDDVGESYDKQWFLKIINPLTLQTRVIFIGPWVTSHYKWINNNTVRAYVGGASGARSYHDTDIHIKEPFVAADHSRVEDSWEWGFEAWWEYDDLDSWPQ
jgi:hypothetical protein